MPPKLQLFTARSLAFRTVRPVTAPTRCIPSTTATQSRFASDDAAAKQPKGPNMDQLPHVSEEQAAMDKTMGQTPPDIEQGTPVNEILSRDPEAKDKAPQVIKDKVNKPSSPSGQKRSYSTSARRPAEVQAQESSQELVRFKDGMAQGLDYPDAGLGHKFPLPDVSTMPRTHHFKRRYDMVIDQVTKALMRHGKLSVAQKNMSIILDTLRTAPSPQPSAAFPGRTLITTSPRQGLPLSPIEYLTSVIDSVAPLIKIRQQRGIAGGGASLPIPVPLHTRQRRRTAIQWILAAAENRRETRLADRVAKEIINVAEGKSGAWERRALVHRLGTTARSNIKTSMLGRT